MSLCLFVSFFFFFSFIQRSKKFLFFFFVRVGKETFRRRMCISCYLVLFTNMYVFVLLIK